MGQEHSGDGDERTARLVAILAAGIGRSLENQASVANGPVDFAPDLRVTTDHRLNDRPAKK